MKSKRSYISIKSVLLFCVAENIDWLGWEIGGVRGESKVTSIFQCMWG